MAVDLFGWELIYRSVENDLLKKEDLLVAFTHWFLIKSGFSCIGNGNSKNLTGSEVKSEVLSSGWNSQDDYNIRYVQDDRLYLLRASVTGEDIIFNFLRADDLCISSCIFKVDETVKGIKGNISTTIPNYTNVLGTLRRELLEPVFTKTTTTAMGTQTAEQTVNPRPDRVTPEVTDPLRVQPRRPPIPDPLLDPLRDPLSVGRSDLDPFARGGGMIFDPFGPRTDRRGPTTPGPLYPGDLPRYFR
ncbi:UNVERIFIED_CONTAM: hypothetical protein PYX00_010174 [Menopon gallinae]|uniref:Proteasome inhibitor PI31 subunit n=1 Tax=Menopon gallinae TaxID=328185 RepID=A0AAW2HE04_9NEOP